MLSIRPMMEAELPQVYAHVARDFPPIEYPPLYKMRRHVARRAVEGLLCDVGAQRAAYAFVLRADGLRRVMLFLYAVEPELRGKGVGSAFLEELLGRYAACAGLYAEVEKAELAEEEAERRVRLRRIAFYRRLGFAPVEGLYYSIYGVEMHLFYRPLQDPGIPGAQEAVRDATALYEGILLPHERYNLDARPAGPKG